MTDHERLDALQDVLIKQRNTIDETLELVERWLLNLEAERRAAVTLIGGDNV